MMKLKVISCNGQAPAQALEAHFDELGGAIGRGEGNALTLPDPERFISRTHATIAWRNGGYVLRDLSSASPVMINGEPLGSSREAKLSHGDRITIGSYVMQAFIEMPESVRPDDAAWSRPGAPVRASTEETDPLALFGGPAGDAFGPGAGTAPGTSVSGDGRDGGTRPRDIIPTGFDPFGDLMPASSSLASDRAEPARVPASSDLGLGPASSQSIDDLFGLDPSKRGEPFAQGHWLSASDDAVSGGGSLDPLVAIGAAQAPAPGAPPQRDDAPEIQGAFTPPVATFPDALPAAAEVTPAVDSASMLFSWNETEREAGGDIKTMVVLSPQPASTQAERGEARPALPPQAGPLKSPTPEVRAPEPHQPQEPDALLKAFLQGAGVPQLAMAGPLTPETMHTVGQLLRASTQGMLDLLLARALLKREFHADVTIIAARENNPLKFSPTVEVALEHLLLPRGPGFKTPVDAITDACDDLRAHQFGFMAGMRAALEGVLCRFDPALLERRLASNGLVDSVLPMHRKARLWEQFAGLYAEINREAQEDFMALFGKEFLRAYQSQLDQLDKRDQNAGDAPDRNRRQTGRGNGA